jgi:hypothetical protein
MGPKSLIGKSTSSSSYRDSILPRIARSISSMLSSSQEMILLTDYTRIKATLKLRMKSH